jgi:class 3 adenylate cyclase
MADDYRLAAILAVGIDTAETLALRGERAARRAREVVAGLLESRSVEGGGALRSVNGPLLLAEFPSALAAVQCAQRMREAAADEPLLRLRQGAHLGDTWFFGDQALGEGVDIARRLSGVAQPGGILVSTEVHRQIEGRIEARACRVDADEVAGFEQPMVAWEIIATGVPDAAVPQEPPRAERIIKRLRAAALAGGIERLLVPGADAQPHAETDLPADETHRAELAEIEAEREAARRGAFRAHLTAFAAVNALLLIIWFVKTPFAHPWFLYGVAGWGVGLAQHFVATLMGKRQRRELALRLTAEQKRTLRRIHRAESGWAQHLTAFGTVNTCLLMVNMITTPAFPWFLFPLAGWTVGAVSHNLHFRVRRRSLMERLRRLGVVRGELVRMRDAAATTGRFGSLVDEAMRIKDSLARQILGSEPLRSRFGVDVLPLLDRYLGQIRSLNERSRDLDGLLSTLSEEQLEAEIGRLSDGREAARSASVQAEYDRAIAQHRQQRDSLEELRGQQEILDLRIRGSVLTLKRIEMDVARMKGLETAQVMSSLREKSEEMSRYLEDLRAGYRELEG